MNAIVIGCQTIGDEIKKALSETASDLPIIWVEAGLHNYPHRLRARLQEEISRISNVENILIAFGFCGNASLGLHSDSAKLIVPRVDDCISLLLGSRRNNEERAEGDSYFLTRGWMQYENTILNEYERCIANYGEARTKRVFDKMLKHYARIVLIDTGAYRLDECLDRSRSFAKQVGLQHKIVPGDLDYLRKLFAGSWDDNFVVLLPGEVLSFEHCQIKSTSRGLNLCNATPMQER